MSFSNPLGPARVELDRAEIVDALLEAALNCERIDSASGFGAMRSLLMEAARLAGLAPSKASSPVPHPGAYAARAPLPPPMSAEEWDAAFVPKEYARAR